jgi:predicted amidophosphoribosyltransferase
VLTEPELRMRHGWGKKSDMPSKYAHLNQEDLDDKILQSMGIKKTEVKEETMKECVYCKISFPLEIKYCNVCSRPIDINDALEMEKESQEGTKAMMYELMRKEKADKAKRNHQGEKDKKVNKQIKQQAEEIQMLRDMITKMSKPE